MIDSKTSALIQNISQEIYRRFPDLRGRSPRVQLSRPGGKPRPGLRLFRRPDTFLLVYQGQKTTSTGKLLPYAVRVVVDAKGKILKITMSH